MDGDTFEMFDAAVSNRIICTVIIRPMSGSKSDVSKNEATKRDNSTTRGRILKINEGKLYFEMDSKLKRNVSECVFSIEFFHTRAAYQITHQALEYVAKHKLQRFFHPKGPFGCPISKTYKK